MIYKQMLKVVGKLLSSRYRPWQAVVKLSAVTNLSSTLSSMVASAKAKNQMFKLIFVLFFVSEILHSICCFFVILNLKILGNGRAWTISTLVPAKVFKSDFSLLRCAATPRKCSHHVGEEITSMIGGNWEGRKTKNRLFLLDFPFLWGFGIGPEWE